MSIQIHCLDEHGYLEKKEVELIQQVLTTACQLEGLDGVEISLTFVSNEEIRELNRQYRNKDAATDVLSFPMYDKDEELLVDDEDELLMLGDIIISVEKAREQALAYGHSFQRELAFLAVHGFLHLIGYDHETAAEETKMMARQEEILTKHGLVR